MNKTTASTVTQLPEADLEKCPSDSITILQCGKNCTASKRFYLDEAGEIKRIDFNAGMFFDVTTKPVSGIRTLSDVLLELERRPNALVIRGNQIDASGRPNRSLRRKTHFATPPEGRRWALPAEFHQCSYHYQLSSSAGMGDPSKVSAHLWFWLTEPWPDTKIKEWAKAVNLTAGYKLVDPALFNDVQAHYTAAPIFDGVANPIPVRSGLVEKAVHAVAIRVIEMPTTERAMTTGAYAPSPGFEGFLAAIGDHSGGHGFHGPIIQAIASYASTNGRDATDVELLYNTINARVLSADRSQHDDSYIERAASREQIMPAIESALAKFGDAAKHKSRITSGVEAHFPSHAESNAVAQKKLRDVIGKVIAVYGEEA
ncbi:MAG: hypothetical protein NT123_24770 [Proteobacteria bacterium]|nr:hypothetical protein [Pseudomonadota bacterium]